MLLSFCHLINKMMRWAKGSRCHFRNYKVDIETFIYLRGDQCNLPNTETDTDVSASDYLTSTVPRWPLSQMIDRLSTCNSSFCSACTRVDIWVAIVEVARVLWWYCTVLIEEKCGDLIYWFAVWWLLLLAVVYVEKTTLVTDIKVSKLS